MCDAVNANIDFKGREGGGERREGERREEWLESRFFGYIMVSREAFNSLLVEKSVPHLDCVMG